jgi:hypothetical protein
MFAMIRAGMAQFLYLLGYRLDNRDLNPAKGKGPFSLHNVKPGSGAHPAFYSMDTGGSICRVKRPLRETDRSHPCRAEGENGGAISTPPYDFMAFNYTGIL